MPRQAKWGGGVYAQTGCGGGGGVMPRQAKGVMPRQATGGYAQTGWGGGVDAQTG